MNKEYSDKDNDEIDVLELIGLVRSQKKTVFKFAFVFMLIGIFIAVFTKDVYEASVTLVPQLAESNKISGLGGLAAMAGINIGGSGKGGDISPNLYQKITANVPFRRALIESLIQVEGVSEKISFKKYYESYNNLGVLDYVRKYTIGLPGLIISAMKKEKKETKYLNKKDGIYRVSNLEDILFSYIDKALVLDINDKDGIMKIKFSMPEALASAQMVKATQELLQNEITKFKTEKINSDYNFIEQTYKEAKKDFLNKQLLLANYRDRHQGLILSKSKTRLNRLEAEYNLSYSLYSNLSKELSSQKIMLKKNTPIFTVLESVSVPLRKSKPRRAVIFAIWLFSGILLGIGTVLCKEFLTKFNQKND